MSWIRSAAFNAWFYVVTTLFCLASPVPRRGSGPKKMARSLAYAGLWARATLAGLHPLVGIEWRITGLEHLPDGPALLAAQHQSAFETLLWVAVLPRVCFVVKHELMRIPLFGGMLKACGMIGVDRDAGAQALRGMLQAGMQASASGRHILVFPEGTRVAPGVRVPLHVGVAALATRTGLPVIPVLTDSGRCWGRRSFRKTPGVIHLQILPPLPAGLPREALLARLSDLFAAGPAHDDA